MFSREVLERLSADPSCVLEREPLEGLAADGELCVYPHEGFWQCADTVRDVELLRNLWDRGDAPWRIWDDRRPVSGGEERSGQPARRASDAVELVARSSIRSREVARETRRLVVEAAIRARTCHIGSSLSIVDILAVLYADVLPDDSGRPAGRFLLSKGHAASALYGTLVVEGVLSLETMLTGYCSDGGSLAGHPRAWRGRGRDDRRLARARTGDRGRDRARRTSRGPEPRDILPRGRRRAWRGLGTGRRSRSRDSSGWTG